MSIKAPFQSDPAHKVRKIIFKTCQTLHLPELDLTEALTFAKEMVMTFFIKQGREEIFLFGQLPHQFLLVLRRGHFLKHKFKKKISRCQSSVPQKGAQTYSLRSRVSAYLNFFFLLIQASKYIDFQPSPEIESIYLQSRCSL